MAVFKNPAWGPFPNLKGCFILGSSGHIWWKEKVVLWLPHTHTHHGTFTPPGSLHPRCVCLSVSLSHTHTKLQWIDWIGVTKYSNLLSHGTLLCCLKEFCKAVMCFYELVASLLPWQYLKKASEGRKDSFWLIVGEYSLLLQRGNGG